VEPPHTQTAKSQVTAGGVAGAVGGGVVGVYAGANVLFPLVGMGAVWLLSKKLATLRANPYLSAISIQSGHLLWLVIGTALVGAWSVNAGDIVVLTVGLVWLITRPGLWPLVFLSTYHAVALLVNAVVLSQQSFGSAWHKALVVHIALRVLALFFMWQAYLRLRKGEPRAT
jgi:hypothetical protein